MIGGSIKVSDENSKVQTVEASKLECDGPPTSKPPEEGQPGQIAPGPHFNGGCCNPKLRMSVEGESLRRLIPRPWPMKQSAIRFARTLR